MSFGLRCSLILHIAAIALALIGFSFPKKSLDTHMVVAVDLVKVSEFTNLKNKKVQEIEKKSEEKEEVKKLEQTPQAKQEQKKPEPSVTPKETEKPKDKLLSPKKPQEKAKEKPKDKQKKKEKPSEIDSFLKELEKEKDESKDGKLKSKKAKADNEKIVKSMSDKMFDENSPLSISEMDNIQNQIANHFANPVVFEFKPGEVVVQLKLQMAENGEIKSVNVTSGSKYSSVHASAFEAIKNSLIRACYKSSPLQNLPADKFSDGWSEIIVTFDASRLMN